MEFKDYYKLLEVARDADADTIKKAYRRLARKYHPDVSKERDAEARFKEINEAYEVLKDRQKRQAYDQLGANWKAGQDFHTPPGWQGTGGAGGSAGFSDFFESLFGGAYRTRGAFRRKGADQQAEIRVGIEDVYHGATRSLRLANGKNLQVKIPAGIGDGKRIRLSGQGGAGSGGAPSGDLLLTVNIAAHAYFRVQGRDVSVDVPIAPWEAALGASIQVPTLGGRVDVKIPPGTRSGGKLRLKGRGMPGQPPGDQYVVLQIDTPPAKSDAQRRFYENMRETFSFNPRAHLE